MTNSSTLSTTSEATSLPVILTNNSASPDATSSTTQPSNPTTGDVRIMIKLPVKVFLNPIVETTIIPSPSDGSVISDDKKRNYTGLIIGLVLASIVAITVIGIIIAVVIVLHRHYKNAEGREFSLQNPSSASNGNSRPGRPHFQGPEMIPLTDLNTFTSTAATPLNLPPALGNHNQQEGEEEPVNEADLDQ